MKKIKLCGFGKQGMKAIKEIEANNRNIEKSYVDNEEKDFNILNIPLSKRVQVRLQYDIDDFSSWLQIKEIFKSPWVERKIYNYIENASLLIFAFGLGESISMFLMELLAFMQENNCNVPVLVVASQPLKSQTETKSCCVLTNRVINFLRSTEKIGWTIIDTEKLLNLYNGDEGKTLKFLHVELACVVREFLRWVDEDNTEQHKVLTEQEMASLLNGLIYFFSFKSTSENVITQDEIIEKNEYHSYVPDVNSEIVLASMRTSLAVGLMETHDYMCELQDFFSEETNLQIDFRHQDGLKLAYLSTFISAGREVKGHGIRFEQFKRL